MVPHVYIFFLRNSAGKKCRDRVGASARDGGRPRDPRARRQRVRRGGRGRRRARRGRAVFVGAGRRRLLAAASRARRLPGDGRRARDRAARPRRRSTSTPRASRSAGRRPRGGTAAAIPGVPAALAHVAQRYGKLPLAATLAPAIRSRATVSGRSALRAHRAAARARFCSPIRMTARIFLDGKRAPQRGLPAAPAGARGDAGAARAGGRRRLLRRPRRARAGRGGERGGGVWQLADLADYRVIERAPVRFQYRGATITTAALPSAGGIALAQSLKMLERFPPSDARAPDTDHLVVEALRRAFHDRARYLGDPDFVPVPVARLVRRSMRERRAATSTRRPRRAATRWARSGSRAPEAPTRRTCRSSTPKAIASPRRSRSTCCSARASSPATPACCSTTRWTISRLRPDVPNAFRLRGGVANAIEPRKRPLSSMTPTFVEDDKGVLILGAPGGSRIVSQVLLAILDYVAHAEGRSRAPRARAALSPSVLARPRRGRAGGLLRRSGARRWRRRGTRCRPRAGSGATCRRCSRRSRPARRRRRAIRAGGHRLVLMRSIRGHGSTRSKFTAERVQCS